MMHLGIAIYAVYDYLHWYCNSMAWPLFSYFRKRSVLIWNALMHSCKELPYFCKTLYLEQQKHDFQFCVWHIKICKLIHDMLVGCWISENVEQYSCNNMFSWICVSVSCSIQPPDNWLMCFNPSKSESLGSQISLES